MTVLQTAFFLSLIIKIINKTLYNTLNGERVGGGGGGGGKINCGPWEI